jgi:hypothetical protein
MRSCFGLRALVVGPLILVDLGLLMLAGFLLGGSLVLTVPLFHSEWPLTTVMTIAAAAYLTGLVCVVADSLQGGLHQLRTPKRALRCSLFGLAVNTAGAIVGLLALVAAFAFGGALF